MNENLEKVIEGLQEIKKLIPSNMFSVSIHDVNIKDLNIENWKIEAGYVPESKTTYLTAKPKKDLGIDLTLFD